MHFCALIASGSEEASQKAPFSPPLPKPLTPPPTLTQLAGLALGPDGILSGQELCGLILWKNEMVMEQRILREEAGIRGLCHY